MSEDFDSEEVDWFEDETDEDVIGEDRGDLVDQLYGDRPIERSIDDFYPSEE